MTSQMDVSTKYSNKNHASRAGHQIHLSAGIFSTLNPGRFFLRNKWIIFLFGFLLFSGIIKQEPIFYDDYEHLYSNVLVDDFSFRSIAEIFQQSINDTYIPLTTLTWAVEKHIFGVSPEVSKTINILLHLLTANLVFKLGIRLKYSISIAFWAAAVFYVHPMRVESVAWITERKDVLFAPLYLMACLSYLDFFQAGRFRDYLTAIIFAALAILSKPMAVSLPFILLLLEWRMNRKLSFPRAAPFFLIAAMFGGITWLPSHDVIMSDGGLTIWIQCAGEYLINFFSPIFVFPLKSFVVNTWIIAAGVILIAVMATYKPSRFGCAFFFLTIFFILRNQVLGHDTVADRFMYLPCVGFCYFLGDILSKIRKPIAAFFLVTLLVKMWTLVPIWNDSRTFAQFVVANNSGMENFWKYLGEKEYIEENYVSASGYYTLCLDYAVTIEIQDACLAGRGKSYFYMDLPDYAGGDLERVNQYADDIDTLEWRGFLRLNRGDYAGAVHDLNLAVTLAPEDENNFYNLAHAYKGLKHPFLAQLNFQRGESLAGGDDSKKYRKNIIDNLVFH